MKEAPKKVPKPTYENNYVEMNKRLTRKEPPKVQDDQDKLMKALYSDFS